MTRAASNGSVKSHLFSLIAKSLGNVPLNAMEKYAIKQGGEHERVIEKIKVKYW